MDLTSAHSPLTHAKSVRCFSNNKPWVTPELKTLLNEKKRAFLSGDKEELRRVQMDLKYNIIKCKDCYRKKLEQRLEQNNIRDVWRGLKQISGHAPSLHPHGPIFTLFQLRRLLPAPAVITSAPSSPLCPSSNRSKGTPPNDSQHQGSESPSPAEERVLGIRLPHPWLIILSGSPPPFRPPEVPEHVKPKNQSQFFSGRPHRIVESAVRTRGTKRGKNAVGVVEFLQRCSVKRVLSSTDVTRGKGLLKQESKVSQRVKILQELINMSILNTSKEQSLEAEKAAENCSAVCASSSKNKTSQRFISHWSRWFLRQSSSPRSTLVPPSSAPTPHSTLIPPSSASTLRLKSLRRPWHPAPPQVGSAVLGSPTLRSSGSTVRRTPGTATMEASLLLCVFLFFPTCFSNPVSRPTNWLRQCRASTNLSLKALEVLPGGGWDNLRNMDMGRVMNFGYFQCQTTKDGLYLNPDEVFVVPYKETGVETNSEIISSWLDQKGSTAASINDDVSDLPVLNAKFSSEIIRMKTHQVKDSSTTARVQSYPDFALDSRFAHQVKEIADAIENNQTKRADYLSEKMVVDFGTHVITSVDAGASLSQEDYLRSSYVSNSISDIVSIKSTAGLNFFDKLKFDISSDYTQKSSTLQNYQSNIMYSIIQSHGGAPFYPGISLQKWQESTKNNLVAIDRSGVPLHYLINSNTMQDLPQPTLNKVALTVYQAIERYYKINTRPGCVDVTAKNYSFQANVDDKSCEGPATNLSFGGVYQSCIKLSSDADPLCEELAQKNPNTGDLLPLPLHPIVIAVRNYQRTYVSQDFELATRFSVPFGGLFSCESVNPLANNQRRCPPGYSQHLGTVSDGCEILYCVQSGLFTGGELLPIHLPPFTRTPLVSTVMVMTEGDKSWVRVGGTKAWKLAKPQEINKIMKEIHPELNEMSSGQKVGVAFGVICLVVLIVIMVVALRRKRRGSNFRAGSYEAIPASLETETEQEVI
ncbi:macrophage-expressed gene 1 protein-like [Oryzias latipes]|uniref:macrophage-expressed gene 1 protein-like n=1 Tax=Oryzias latipes TaxID=8090 RepID=UPI000CE23FF3|nr:macrophage-expressed gene 1 protein-like [Oryzias latipes]